MADEKQLITRELKTDKTIGEIASLMAITPTTLRARIKQYGLKTNRKAGRRKGYRKPLKAK